MWNIKAGGAEPGKVEGAKGEWWNRMRYVGKSRRQKVEKKSKDLPERKDLRLREKLNQGGKMVSIFNTALGQLRMIWSWSFLTHFSGSSPPSPQKTSFVVSSMCKIKKISKPSLPQKGFNECCLHTTPACQGWKLSKVRHGPPSASHFHGCQAGACHTTSMVTATPSLALLWFWMLKHQAELTADLCLPQRLLWKHLEINRDVADSQPFTSRLYENASVPHEVCRMTKFCVKI